MSDRTAPKLAIGRLSSALRTAGSVTVQSSGLIATLKAVGGGTANITATSEGKVSAAIQVIVSSTCCSVGEGAPTSAVQQALQDAVARNRLTLQLPGGERVRRVGAGYVQEFTGTNGARYVLAVSDKTGQGYVLTGAILTRYEEAGGPSSALGYPASDPTAGGRQTFDGGALAGNPVRAVTASILQKWSVLGFESGALGPPGSEAAMVLSFTGTTGVAQVFCQGVIVSSPRGSFYMSGLILARYAGMGSAGGALGLPLSDEFASAGTRKQEFEGGSVEYGATDIEARAITRDRKPGVNAAPGAVVPGSFIRLTVSGFPDGSSIRVSTTGQTDFVVRTANGAYTWDARIPAGASGATVKIRATDTANPAVSADGEYRIRSAAEIRARLEIAGGDTQSSAPGAMLRSPLRLLLKDEQGMALSGVTVRFSGVAGSAGHSGIGRNRHEWYCRSSIALAGGGRNRARQR